MINGIPSSSRWSRGTLALYNSAGPCHSVDQSVSSWTSHASDWHPTALSSRAWARCLCLRYAFPSESTCTTDSSNRHYKAASVDALFNNVQLCCGHLMYHSIICQSIISRSGSMEATLAVGRPECILTCEFASEACFS